MATRSIPRRKATPSPTASASAAAHVPSNDDVSMAADYVRRAMGDLLIYAAALERSECEVARFVGVRLGGENLVNDLDVAREILVGTGQERAS